MLSLLLPILTGEYNATLLQTLSDIVGQGFGIAFGSPLVIAIIILALFFGTLYSLRFSLDVTIVIMVVVLLAYITPQAIGNTATILPGWLILIPVFIVSALILWAISKIFRR